MPPPYILYLDNKEQQDRIPTLYGTIEALWSHLETVNEGYRRNFGNANNGKAWIVTDACAKGTQKVDKTAAYRILQKQGTINLYCECTSCGLFYTGSARREDVGRLVPKSHKIDKLVMRTKNVEQQFQRMLDHESTSTWEPHEVNPVQALAAAEERIFGFNLYHALQASSLGLEEIEEKAGFAPDTLLAMMSAIKPLRPTGAQIDKLARILKVKPEELWYDAVAVYLDATNSWDKYIKMEDTP